MFAADLSWTDQPVEFIGERRERKARSASRRTSHSSASTVTPPNRQESNKRPVASIKVFGSGFGSLRKSPSQKLGKGWKPTKPSLTAPNSYAPAPGQRPNATLAANISATLPSGRPIDEGGPPQPWHENTEKILYSRPTMGNNGVKSNNGALRSWTVNNKADADEISRSYDKVKEQIYGMQIDKTTRAETFLSLDSSSKASRPDDRYQDSVLELPVQGCEITQIPGRTPMQPSARSPLPVTMRDGIARTDYFSQPTEQDRLQSPALSELTEEVNNDRSADILEELPAILQTITVDVIEEHHRKAHPDRPRARYRRTHPAPPPAPSAGAPKRGKTPPRRPPRPDEPRSRSHTQNTSRPRSINKSQWQAPNSWEVMPGDLLYQKETQHDSMSPESSPEPKEAPLHPPGVVRKSRTPDEVTHFQTFVRRMETAGPKIILDRLKEDWEDPADEIARDEVIMEKHLWALTALHLKAMDKFAKAGSVEAPSLSLPSLGNHKRRRVLELDGNLGEVYQLSAIYPDSKIAYLQSRQHEFHVPLPSQAEVHPLPDQIQPGSVDPATFPFIPLPYPNNSMHHIRSARLPTLLPANKLHTLINECYRVLRPGGVLELRLIDPLPERGTTGPLLLNWLEDRLLIGLEAGFRCTRPIALVPQWVQEAGFVPLNPKLETTTNADGRTTAIGPQSSSQSTKQDLARTLRLPAAAENLDLDVLGTTSRSMTATISAPGSRYETLTVSQTTGAKESDANKEATTSQLGCLVARALWKDCWGEFLVDPSDIDHAAVENMLNGSNGNGGVVEDYWWWEDPEILEECREWRTVWSVGTLVAVKLGGED